jgi:hypothetical protein
MTKMSFIMLAGMGTHVLSFVNILREYITSRCLQCYFNSNVYNFYSWLKYVISNWKTTVWVGSMYHKHFVMLQAKATLPELFYLHHKVNKWQFWFMISFYFLFFKCPLTYCILTFLTRLKEIIFKTEAHL